MSAAVERRGNSQKGFEDCDQGRNLTLTVLFVPYSLAARDGDGHTCRGAGLTHAFRRASDTLVVKLCQHFPTRNC